MSDIVKKTAPKWGTTEWILAYPWTQMDRKRRQRVRKLLAMPGDPVVLDCALSIKSLVKDSLDELKVRGNIQVSAKDIAKVVTATEVIQDFFAKYVNTVIACDLAKKWKVKCSYQSKSCKCNRTKLEKSK